MVTADKLASRASRFFLTVKPIYQRGADLGLSFRQPKKVRQAIETYTCKSTMCSVSLQLCPHTQHNQAQRKSISRNHHQVRKMVSDE
ncbi:hypothetical protein PoB_003096700 [Plakobranchus ocellatus]|uniref:Uncharacterized protein n=1 Tax=Plakobranchus ocellatus TaxID=259542 RepID=A0AAV4AB50_9GAST|nr:hypothetical protein PoB_003096700 [Plakobranchus ocellatus]